MWIQNSTLISTQIKLWQKNYIKDIFLKSRGVQFLIVLEYLIITFKYIDTHCCAFGWFRSVNVVRTSEGTEKLKTVL